MKRILVLLALAGLAIGCGDDDGGDDDDDKKPATDGGMDAGDSAVPKPDSGAEAGPPPVIKVSNVLAACASASTCTGTAPLCQSISVFSATRHPGTGACTAECTQDSECGNMGACPLGEAIKTFGSFPGVKERLGQAGYCSKSCTLGTATSCPTGYACVTINILSMQNGGQVFPGMVPLDDPFCLPVTPLDGGVPDGGVGDGGVTDGGGMDAAQPG
jgi:hypothetical protein